MVQKPIERNFYVDQLVVFSNKVFICLMMIIRGVIRSEVRKRMKQVCLAIVVKYYYRQSVTFSFEFLHFLLSQTGIITIYFWDKKPLQFPRLK